MRARESARGSARVVECYAGRMRECPDAPCTCWMTASTFDLLRDIDLWHRRMPPKMSGPFAFVRLREPSMPHMGDALLWNRGCARRREGLCRSAQCAARQPGIGFRGACGPARISRLCLCRHRAARSFFAELEGRCKLTGSGSFGYHPTYGSELDELARAAKSSGAT